MPVTVFHLPLPQRCYKKKTSWVMVVPRIVSRLFHTYYHDCSIAVVRPWHTSIQLSSKRDGKWLSPLLSYFLKRSYSWKVEHVGILWFICIKGAIYENIVCDKLVKRGYDLHLFSTRSQLWKWWVYTLISQKKTDFRYKSQNSKI